LLSSSAELESVIDKSHGEVLSRKKECGWLAERQKTHRGRNKGQTDRGSTKMYIEDCGAPISQEISRSRSRAHKATHVIAFIQSSPHHLPSQCACCSNYQNACGSHWCPSWHCRYNCSCTLSCSHCCCCCCCCCCRCSCSSPLCVAQASLRRGYLGSGSRLEIPTHGDTSIDIGDLPGELGLSFDDRLTSKCGATDGRCCSRHYWSKKGEKKNSPQLSPFLPFFLPSFVSFSCTREITLASSNRWSDKQQRAKP
jgi:hypothetical protein